MISFNVHRILTLEKMAFWSSLGYGFVMFCDLSTKSTISSRDIERLTWSNHCFMMSVDSFGKLLRFRDLLK